MWVRWGTSHQNARLQSLLKEIDSEWEKLTCSLQADRDALNSLQPRMEHLRHQLVVAPGTVIDTSPALAAHLKRLEQQAERLRQVIQLKEQERRALERHFDQARLAAAAGRQHTTPQGLRQRCSGGKAALSRPFVRLLRGFKQGLHPFVLGNESVPHDWPLNRIW